MTIIDNHEVQAFIPVEGNSSFIGLDALKKRIGDENAAMLIARLLLLKNRIADIDLSIDSSNRLNPDSVNSFAQAAKESLDIIESLPSSN